jgi:hypothetical protein
LHTLSYEADFPIAFAGVDPDLAGKTETTGNCNRYLSQAKNRHFLLPRAQQGLGD